MRWEQVSIGDLFLKKSSNRKQKDLVSEGYPVFGASGLSGFAHDFDVQVPYFGVVKDGAGVGRVSVHPAESSVVGTMECLIPKPGLHFEFLGYCLRQIRFERYVTGSTIPHVYFKDYKNEMVALPPLEEQKRIAGILDEADRVRKKTQVLIDKYDELAQSLFLDMFGDPVTNPKGWEVRKGADLFDLNSGKYLPTRELSDSFEYPCFGGNGVTGYANEYLLSEETLVIGRVGAYCGNVHLTPPKSWVTDNAIYIKSMSDAFRLKWLEFVFKSMNFHRFADFSGQPKITQKPIYGLLYPVPPIKKQMEFEDQLNKLSKVKSNQHSVLCKENNLLEALLQKAFKGELT